MGQLLIILMKEIMEKKELILIGEIVAASGIKGEVKVKSFSRSPERFGELAKVILSRRSEAAQTAQTLQMPPAEQRDSGTVTVAEYQIEKARVQGNMAILKFKGVEDRNRAETLVGYGVNITEEDLEELPEDTYYIKDLKGLTVINHKTGEVVGTIKDVLQNSAQDIYVVETAAGDALVPAVKEFIKEVNVGEGFLRIDFIEGMLP